MARFSAITVGDPVVFGRAGKDPVRGHVARKAASKAIVIDPDRSEWTVPCGLLRPDRQGCRKRLFLRDECAKAKFRPDDEVTFEFNGRVLAGVIARYLPTRARVVCDDEAEFDVPYPGLRSMSHNPGRRSVGWLARTAALAEELMARHDLEGWSFQYDDASGRAGVCNFDSQVIGLSLLYCLGSSGPELEETILHEVAHALAGPQHQHDRVWREIAQSIGCSGERLCSVPAFAPPRYIVSCPSCGWALRRNVRRAGQVCAKCRGGLRVRTYTNRAWQAAAPESVD